jgi:REP element-mobilizing transposase RayT
VETPSRAKTIRKTRRPAQLPLPSPKGKWGGYRFGAGRKKNVGEPGYVRHVRRPRQVPSQPVHVTMKVVQGAPSLRSGRVLLALRECLRAIRGRAEGFRVIHYSIQSNHFHLVVETDGTRELSRGMQGLNLRVAHALRRLSPAGRPKGRFFVERYHARAFASPVEARNVLRYVLLNWRHHAGGAEGVLGDPASSARFLDGWVEPAARRWRRTIGAGDEVVPPRTWLLRDGWKDRSRGGGPISLRDVPGGEG